MACPCCGSGRIFSQDVPLPHQCCASCGHVFRHADDRALERYYAAQQRRNAQDMERKTRERLADVAPLLRDGMRVLEIGCAEGDLGRRVKELAQMHYTGVEPSRDADSSRRVLDRVVPSAAALEGDRYDLVLAFHVLEHVAEPSVEVDRWRRLTVPGATLIVEVPNGSGNPLVAFDGNPEHVHQFSAASLAALLLRCRFSLERLSRGHHESPLYPDSLRALAQPATDAAAQRAQALKHLRARLPGPFVIYGVGGDFRTYLLPLLDELPVAALVDSDVARRGERIGKLYVGAYDRAHHGALPVLVASLRHGAEIRAALVAAGTTAERIVGIEDIFGPQP